VSIRRRKKRVDRKGALHGREVRYDAKQPDEESLSNNAGRVKKAVVRLVRFRSSNATLKLLQGRDETYQNYATLDIAYDDDGKVMG
jgi:hypothetical protein